MFNDVHLLVPLALLPIPAGCAGRCKFRGSISRGLLPLLLLLLLLLSLLLLLPLTLCLLRQQDRPRHHQKPPRDHLGSGLRMRTRRHAVNLKVTIKLG